MSFTNRHTAEIIENLLDLADDFKLVGRTGAWRVLVDATRIIKLYRENRREPWIESNKRRVINARKTQSEAGIIVLSGPRFSITESGRSGVVSTNSDPDHSTYEGG